ncbi:MAG: PD40 domain-containing protein [Deltaproteobacteria bacterium]|nr:PD40 domain-containing protein [Deltaproteobacteria bacterium]
MNQITKNIVWLAAFLGISSIQALAEPIAKGPYLGQTPPGSTAQVFAPGLICDTRPRRWESHGQFSADGNTFCFNRLRYVYITENTEHGWTTPERIESIPYHSYSCCLSPDANSIYVRCGPFSRLKRRRSPLTKGLYGLRRCMRTSEGWSLPEELGPPFSTWGQRAGFSVSADNSIYFKSTRGGFWVAPFVGNTWSQPRKIPVEMGNIRGCNPGVAPDGSFLVFYSVRPGAQLGTETNLYLTLRQPDGTWTKPRNMGPGINSEYYEHGARISPDKKYMFFIRSTGWNLGPLCDTGDIYWVELKEYLPESYR